MAEPIRRYVRDVVGAPARVLVSESVYEDALLTVNEGHLFIEFKADDLADLALDLESFCQAVED